MRLSHKNKVHKKMAGIGSENTTVTVIRDKKSGAVRCCLGAYEALALIAATGALVYTARQYKIAKRAALANSCINKRPGTKTLCKAQIVHTSTVKIGDVDYISRICEHGHQSLKKVIPFHSFKNSRSV